MSAIQRFLQRLLVERPERRRSPGVAGYLCKKGVGAQDRKDPTWIVYKAEDFSRAETLLREAGLPTEPPQKAIRTSKAADKVAPVGRAPNEVVAVAVLNNPISLPNGVLYMAMGARDAANIPHDVVLICQDLRILREIRKYNWLDRYLKGRRALALFKGGRGASGFTVDGANLAVQLSKAPVLALVDLDIAGLITAARMPRLEALCVPSWRLLEPQHAASARQGLIVNHQLGAASHPDIMRAWKCLRTSPHGLSADNFPVDTL